MCFYGFDRGYSEDFAGEAHTVPPGLPAGQKSTALISCNQRGFYIIGYFKLSIALRLTRAF